MNYIAKRWSDWPHGNFVDFAADRAHKPRADRQNPLGSLWHELGFGFTPKSDLLGSGFLISRNFALHDLKDNLWITLLSELWSPEGPALPWTVQGLGMMRAHLDEKQRFRLHVWDPELVHPGAHTMHSHPWDFASVVVVGQLVDTLYREVKPFEGRDIQDLDMDEVPIHCGIGGCERKGKRPLTMRIADRRTINAGEVYTLRAREDIHVTAPLPGTITLLDRSREGDLDSASVFVPRDEAWVPATPRPATSEEVRATLTRALEWEHWWSYRRPSEWDPTVPRTAPLW